MLDQLVDRLEFGDARHVEAGSRLVKLPDNRRVAVGLHRVIDLDAWQVLPELCIILTQHLVIHDEKRRAPSSGKPQQSSLIHIFLLRWGTAPRPWHEAPADEAHHWLALRVG